jgi:hypothetical protein
MGTASVQQFAQFERDHPDRVNPVASEDRRMLYGAVSPDGIQWKRIDAPLVAHFNDSQPVIYFDEFLRRYVGYFRLSVMNRRAIGRAETTDFDRWPVPDLMLWSDPSAGSSVDYYTQARVLYPGTRTAHLMFPSLYDRRLDSLSSRMASSLDGRTWSFLPGERFVEPGPDGSWDGGCIFVGAGMAELGRDRVGIPFTAYHVPHKFPRMVSQGDVGLATWKKERLVALVADEDGEFYTPKFAVSGDELYLNLSTPRTGWVRVEVVGDEKRQLASCDPLRGDHLKTPVSWQGERTLGRKQVQLRFQLRAAKLFSFEVRST